MYNLKLWNKNLSFAIAYQMLQSTPLTQIEYTYVKSDQTLTNTYVTVTTIADYQWHYLCIDLTPGLDSSVYDPSLVNLTNVRLTFNKC